MFNRKVITSLSNSRVLLVGDVMLDSYWHGFTSRISPEAPVPVVQIQDEEFRVGGAGNVALNAAILGSKVQLLGLVGNDEAANKIEYILREKGVDCDLQRIDNSKTITKLRILSKHQQLIRLDFEDNFPNWNPDVLLFSFYKRLTNVDVVILSDYAKGALRQSYDLISLAKKNGIPVVVDPKGNDYERYRGATIITPNLKEFEAIVGSCSSDEEIESKAISLRDALDLKAVLVTRSEKGMTLLERNKDPFHLPTRAQEVFDVTGAGDTVVATIGVSLAAGMALHDAVLLSNIAAGIVVAKLGTATVSPLELSMGLQENRDIFVNGIYDENDLLDIVNNARHNGEVIVMTNGCFDLLHPGHIQYLEQAKQLGDKLIVAVNDDDSVQRIKGKNRPVNCLFSRMKMLSALQCVDWVVSFSEDTPERIYCKILPDIIVKGGDYSEHEVVGADCVKKAGGKVQVLNYLSGYSTTSLIKKIKEEFI